MGTTYTRQSSTEIVAGEVINAADFNNEFAQLVSAFAASTGHSHDGTAAEGGNVTKLLGTAITIGDGTAGTDIAVTFDGESSDGVLTWKEDEDHFLFSDDIVIDSTKRLYFNDEGGEYISGDGTDLNLVSGADINIPANIGLTFGDDGEKIEGNGTDLTITGNNINLTATADVVIPANVGITFGTGEKIEGDSTDLTITSGADINLTATSDVNIPSGVGVTFGNDGEKIEGDGTDLTISGNNINLTATADVNIPSGVGITFATAEKIESDGTDLSITVGSGGDINIPADIGVTFGNDGEKIEGDGTDLTISGNNINLTATADVVIPADVGITFGSGEKIEGDDTNLTVTSGGDVIIDAEDDIILDANGADVTLKDGGTVFGALSQSGGELLIKSGSSATTAMTMSGANVTFAGTVTIGSAGISEAELEILDGATVTTAELNIIDGDTSATGTTVADADRVVMNDNGTMVQVAVTDLNTYFGGSLVSTGALNSGSITSGFGNIDNGSSNITSGGLLKLDVDADADDLTGDSATGRLTIGASEDLNLYHGGTNSYIVNDTGDLILDTADDIVLDAAGGDVFFKAAGTTFGSATNTSGNLIIKSGTTTALTFSGADVTVAGDLTVSGDDITMATNTSGAALIADGTNFNPVVISGDATIATNGALTIAANAVEGSMLNNNAISGLTALASGLATTDELMVSDAGTLKRMDVSVLSEQFASSGDVTALAIALG